jgi:hypothetical protein
MNSLSLDSPVNAPTQVKPGAAQNPELSLDIRMQIASLQEALLNAHPTMPILLRDIHRNLKSDPAIVTLLSEEDIAIIVSGLKKQTMTEITASVLKTPSATSKAKLSKTTLADL